MNVVTAVGCSWEMTAETSCSAFSIYAAVTHFQINALHVAVTSRATKDKKINPTNDFHYMVWFQKIQILKKNPLDSNWRSISINVCFTSTDKIKLYIIMYFLRATTYLAVLACSVMFSFLYILISKNKL